MELRVFSFNMSGLHICNCLEHEAGPLICFSWRKISNLSYCLLIEGQTCISLYTFIAQNWAVLAYIWVSNVGIVNVIFLFNHKYFAMEVIFGCWVLVSCYVLLIFLESILSSFLRIWRVWRVWMRFKVQAFSLPPFINWG